MDSNTPVDYGTGQHWAAQDALAAVAQAAEQAYRKEMIASGNRDLAEKAANDAATQGRDLIQIYGQQGIQALGQASQTGLGVANLLASEQGPANAFAYDRAINGVNAVGLSNSIGALTGAYHPPAFQAMGSTSPMTLNSMGQDTSGGNSSVIDQLLGMAGNATGQQQQIQSGKLPFSVPQYDANGAGTTTGGQQATTNGQTSTTGQPQTAGQPIATQQPANITINHHYYGDSTGATLPASMGGTDTSPSTQSFSASGSGSTPAQAPSSSGSLGTPQYSYQAQQYLNSMPDPSQVNVKNFNALNPYSQKVALSGYAAKGYDPNQLQSQFQAGLPQFKSPQFSMVS